MKKQGLFIFLILLSCFVYSTSVIGETVVETDDFIFERPITGVTGTGTNHYPILEQVNRTNELVLAQAQNGDNITNWPASFPIYSNVVALGTAYISYVNGTHQILACTGTTTAVFGDYPSPNNWVDYMITLIPLNNSLTVTGNVVLATGWKITNSAYGTPVLVDKSWGVTNRSVLYSIGE